MDSGFGRRLRVAWLRQVMAAALDGADATGASVSLFITDDATVRELNRTYRGKDSATDVLSFSLTEGSLTEGELVPTTPDGARHLGEVVISLPQAERQAQAIGQSLGREVAFLIIHGVLHLLGYGHERPAEERIMRAMQRRLVKRVQEGVGF